MHTNINSSVEIDDSNNSINVKYYDIENMKENEKLSFFRKSS